MIPRDTDRLCPPCIILPAYMLCYIRIRSSFNHTAVLLSFYVGHLLIPSSLNCYHLISSFLVITRFSPPDIVFYCFLFSLCFPILLFSIIIFTIIQIDSLTLENNRPWGGEGKSCKPIFYVGKKVH